MLYYSHMSISDEKAVLREQMKQRRLNLSLKEFSTLNATISELLLHQTLFLTKSLIGGYYSMHKEVNLVDAYMQWKKEGKQVLFPDWNKNNRIMNFSKPVYVVLVPGIVFTQNGYRIG